MENNPPNMMAQEDGHSTKRGRIMGKLFGRDRERVRKVSQEGDMSNTGDLNDFLRGPSDTLAVVHAGPPMLAKLDIKTATRYPKALDVQGHGGSQQDLAYRPRSHSPGMRIKKGKGLVVSFVDTHPEIIGIGGDECEVPTAEIARNRRIRPPAVTMATAPAQPTSGQPAIPTVDESPGSFVPGQLRRTQTGYSAVLGPSEHEIPGGGVSLIPAGRSVPARYLDNPVVSSDERRRSFIEIHQAEMREAEGLAFAKAVRSGTPPPEPAKPAPVAPSRSPNPSIQGGFTESPTSIDIPGMYSQLGQSDPNYSSPSPISSPFLQPGPVSEVPQSLQIRSREQGQVSRQSSNALHPPHDSHHPPSIHRVPVPAAQTSDLSDAMRRTPNLEQSPSSVYSTNSSLFQQYGSLRQSSKISEKDTASPSSSHHPSVNLSDSVASLDGAMKAFITRTRHLFELFRLHSESVRPLYSSTPEELMRAAFWWFLTGRSALENAIRERPTTPESQKKTDMSKQQAHADLAKAYWLSEEILPEIVSRRSGPIKPKTEEACQTLVTNLRRLAGSMERNGFLPPEEALLPQAIDRTIWVEYPELTQDIISLLRGSSNSALGPAQQPTLGMGVTEALPLGDSPLLFCFGRFHVDVFLMEQGRESQRLYLSCFLSIVRPQKSSELMFIIASQDGCVQLRISNTKGAGPVWSDIQWRSDTCTLDIRLPRGFILVVQCSQQNYKTLWNMNDFSVKVHSSLYPKQDELLIFRTTLRAFQYFDNDPQARQFPKDPIAGCEVALFERILREGAATGPRVYHRGYRIAVVTGSRTKTLSGVNQTYTPQAPVQFGFLRSEANDPALSLKFENGRLKGNMVLSFADEQERLQMHSLLIGIALQRDEHVFCEVPIQGVWFSERFGDALQKGLKVFSGLPWQKARIINHDNDGDRPPCVLADRLRVVFEFKDGTFTDRINVAPGELKVRLDVRNPSCIMIFRQSQPDITVAITEAKVSREVPQALAHGLDILRQTPTIRTLMFSSLRDLHAFETAITGFKVLFDGIVSAFAISRRRMVVPIHKKWEAGSTRIQVVQQDGFTQLLAFFDDFAHGKSMGFNLKGTDVFESFSRGGKAGLKIDDAKFPLPKVLGPEDDSAQVAADAAFVCLDLPELPGEHDDITMLFDNESERDRFTSCLPAPVKGSRLSKSRMLN
ncbi:hypothetical protein B0H66DRAFT_469917 [Apodospora peruviana]|uniref:Uncharacterized protein n=1 Tax=Apodospora peruviana TaxID=516989 RepID=A0AAE0IPN7_9PEZI|nr:hypothetical protein B0H66DRAFT_469917 [Apodospora peruviana]